MLYPPGMPNASSNTIVASCRYQLRDHCDNKTKPVNLKSSAKLRVVATRTCNITLAMFEEQKSLAFAETCLFAQTMYSVTSQTSCHVAYSTCLEDEHTQKESNFKLSDVCILVETTLLKMMKFSL